MEGAGWGGYFYSEVQRTTTNTLRFAVDRAIRDRSRTIQSDNPEPVVSGPGSGSPYVLLAELVVQVASRLLIVNSAPAFVTV